MSRVLVCSVRKGLEKDTNKELLYIATYKMPSDTQKGYLWYPKKDEAIINIVIKKDEKPKEFEEYSQLLPGTLIDVFYSVNDASGKAYVSGYQVVKRSPYKAEELFLKTNSGKNP